MILLSKSRLLTSIVELVGTILVVVLRIRTACDVGDVELPVEADGTLETVVACLTARHVAEEVVAARNHGGIGLEVMA